MTGQKRLSFLGNGDGSHARQALVRVQCEIAAAEKNPTMAHLGQSTVELREDNYLSAARPDGQWFMKREFDTILMDTIEA